jgi:hypothetical protein
MTYTTGGLIEATDYNGFAQNTSGANVNGIWGVGSTSYGYGQSTTLATVSPSATVTATQWATLNNRITSMASHQGTTITSRTNPVAGNTVAILNALSTDLTNVTNNRGNAVAQGTQYTAWTGSSSKTTATGGGGVTVDPWTITFTHTVTFPSANAARYFFNAGGLIKWETYKSSTGNPGDVSWNDIATNIVGTLYISGGAGVTRRIAGSNYTGTTLVGGTGTPSVLSTVTGWFEMGTSPMQIYQQYDQAPYNGLYIELVTQTAGAGTQLVLTTDWVEPGGPGAGTTISGGTASSGIVFGTAPSTVVTYIPPSSTYLTETSWGVPTIAATVV